MLEKRNTPAPRQLPARLPEQTHVDATSRVRQKSLMRAEQTLFISDLFTLIIRSRQFKVLILSIFVSLFHIYTSYMKRTAKEV